MFLIRHIACCPNLLESLHEVALPHGTLLRPVERIQVANQVRRWETSREGAELLLSYGIEYDHSMSHHDCQPYYLRTGDSWTKIDYEKKAEDWMKPLVAGQQTGLVEIPANWYLDVGISSLHASHLLTHYFRICHPICLSRLRQTVTVS
jgi:hypothetical protein